MAIPYGTELYFAIFGDANAVYGTMGALLAVVFSAYLGSIAIVAGAYVAAEASRQPSDADVDAAVMHAQPDGSHAQASVVDRLRGLVVPGRATRTHRMQPAVRDGHTNRSTQTSRSTRSWPVLVGTKNDLPPPHGRRGDA